MTTTGPIPTGAAAAPAAAPPGAPPFETLTRPPGQQPAPERTASLRRIVLQLALIAVLLIAGVLIGATIAATRLADKEAVNNTTNTANLLAKAVVQPAVSDALLTADPRAVAAMDAVVRRSVLPNNIVRVKIWRPDGVVVYSDDPRLIGRQFSLDENQKQALARPQTRAEVSNLSEPENSLDHFASGKVVEVYRPIWTPSGRQLLFEIYTGYDPVSDRAADLRRALMGLLFSAVLLLAVLLAPVVWRLIRQLRAAAQQRERLMQRAVEASEEERRRIAVNLHDGPVQELVASAYATAGAAQRADTSGRPDDAAAIRSAEAAVRSSIGSLRSVLVDLYPATLANAGLASAIGDLAAPLRSRGVDVRLELAEDALAALDPEQERLVYRTAGECLRNVATHAEAQHVELAVHRTADAVELTVADDGAGFAVAAVRDEPAAGHLGLRSMIDQAERAGAELAVAAAPGAGTRWRLRVPLAGASR